MSDGVTYTRDMVLMDIRDSMNDDIHDGENPHKAAGAYYLAYLQEPEHFHYDDTDAPLTLADFLCAEQLAFIDFLSDLHEKDDTNA